jgi:hypothetical protein
MLVCGAVGTVGVVGPGAGMGAADTDRPVLGDAGAVGELPHAIDADAATNAAPDVRPRECFVSLRTA